MTLWCQVSGSSSENTGQLLTAWVKHLYLKETPSPVCPVVWPCSRTGHRTLHLVRNPRSRSCGDTGKTPVLEKGPSFLLACRAVGAPSRVAKRMSGPSKGKAMSPHRNVVSLGGEPASWGDGRTCCCHFSSSPERLPPPGPTS